MKRQTGERLHGTASRDNEGSEGLSSAVRSAGAAWRVYRDKFKRDRSLLTTHEGRVELVRKLTRKRTELEVQLYALGIRGPRNHDGIWVELKAFAPEQRARVLLVLGPFLAYWKVLSIITKQMTITPVNRDSQEIREFQERVDAHSKAANIPLGTAALEVAESMLRAVQRPPPTQEDLERFVTDLPLKEAYDYIAGPWFEEWFRKLMNDDWTHLREQATVLVSGAIYTAVKLYSSEAAELRRSGASSRVTFAERLPGAACMAQGMDPEESCDWDDFVNRTKKLTIPRSSTLEVTGGTVPEPDIGRSVHYSNEADALMLREEAEKLSALLGSGQAGLTSKEREIIEMSRQLSTSQAIALRLGMKPSTVRVHKRAAVRKLRLAMDLGAPKKKQGIA